MAVLDTSFLVDLERERPPATAALSLLVDREAPLVVPPQAAIEVLAGREDPVAGLADLKGSYHVPRLGRDALLEAARMARESQARGTFPGWADLQVGAFAALAGEVVVTADPDAFRALGCRVWDYRRNAEPPDDEDEG